MANATTRLFQLFKQRLPSVDPQRDQSNNNKEKSSTAKPHINCVQLINYQHQEQTHRLVLIN